MIPTILSGDCIDHCRNVIPPKSVHTIVSSPPYWGLRDYGIPGREWSDGTNSVYGNERHLPASHAGGRK
ncbi:MAG: hypothetical protein E6R03_03520 [Hyphomicrobiaceae bacterium]|nr:MAG: hypothetical protein E6R03_03520 [Hyphomicrobiaceae bacterium]